MVCRFREHIQDSNPEHEGIVPEVAGGSSPVKDAIGALLKLLDATLSWVLPWVEGFSSAGGDGVLP